MRQRVFRVVEWRTERHGRAWWVRCLTTTGGTLLLSPRGIVHPSRWAQ